MNMVSALFRGHPINAVPSKKQVTATLNQFAELLSRDLPLTEIASEMEMTVGSACAWLRILCERMGERVQ